MDKSKPSHLSINLLQDLSIKNLIIEPSFLKLAQKIDIKKINKRNFREEFSILNYLTYAKQNSERYQVLNTSNLALQKNRYIDILCYNHNSVKIDDDFYINGNWINDPIEKDNTKSAIITQGPLPSTMEDFWKVVESSNTKVIVAIVEKSQIPSKCSIYWPLKEKQIQIGEYSIELAQREKNSLYEYSKLIISRQNISFEVEHFYLYQWIDHDIPQPEDIDEFLPFLKLLTNKQQPILFHCSAGIGRSGTIMTLYFLYKEYLKSVSKNESFQFSVFETVRNLREQRYLIVQTPQQYEFIYQLIKQFPLIQNQFILTLQNDLRFITLNQRDYFKRTKPKAVNRLYESF